MLLLFVRRVVVLRDYFDRDEDIMFGNIVGENINVIGPKYLTKYNIRTQLYCVGMSQIYVIIILGLQIRRKNWEN